MKNSGLIAAGTLVLFAATGAAAETVGIGTTKGGATAQVTAAISKVVSAHAGGMQMRTQVMGGTQKYIPVVNAGELEFGVSNMMQYYMAITGTGLSEGHKYDNLRLVATMMTFRPGLVVAKNSGINSVADLRGKRVPSGFKGAPLFRHMMIGMLANARLGYGDVKNIPYIGLRQHWNGFKQGKIDVVIAAIASAPVRDMNAKIKGGVKYLSFDTASDARKRILKFAPKTFLVQVKPGKPFVGVLKPVHVMAFDYMFWAHKGVSNDKVYKATKAMYENEKELHAAGPLWRSHKSKKMAKDQGASYHPGAVKFYKEVGIWKR